MSMQDPIADMLSRIKNAQARQKRDVSMPSSKARAAIAAILSSEGYIGRVDINADGVKKTLSIELKYYEGRPVIERLERVSRPGLRRYRTRDKLPKILGGLGTAIISTSQGLMTDRVAREKHLGGEVICIVA
jgi:small subunit ribosomal protein S8